MLRLIAPSPIALSLLLPFAAAQQPGAVDELLQRIEGQLERGFGPEEPGVAIIATRAGEVVFRRAYGEASLELDVAAAPEMAFCIASVTKPFTATATMLLVQEGKLALDESVAARLDGIEIDERITVEHLLSHTSGLPDFFGIDGFGEGHLHARISPRDLGRAANGQELLFPPGERHEYSNLGYALLGLVIEDASGQPWERFLHERVFAPAGMTRTTYGGDRLVVPGAVTNYEKAGEGWLRAEPLNYSRGYALGGLFSTVDDLAAFDAALRGGKILDGQTLARMEQPPTLGNGEPSGYALGWRVDERRGHRFVHHGGSIHGWRAHIVSVPASEVFVAVLSNRGEKRSPVGGVGMMIAAQLADLKDG